MSRHTWLLLLLPRVAVAGDWEWPEANPGRPSFSDNSDPTAAGAFELETGIATEDGDAGVVQSTFKYGLGEHADVRFNLENTLWGSDLDITAASALVKISPRRAEDRKPGFAIEGYVTIPVATDEKVGGGGLAIASYKRDDLSIDACVIGDVARAAGADTAVTVTPVVSIAYGFGRVEPFVEPGVDLAVSGGGDHNPYVGAGIAVAARKFLVLDAAFYVGHDPHTLVLAGLTYSMFVPPKHHPH